MTDNSMRIGTGYDVHRLVPNRALIVGGVSIPHEMGLLGHSDADVLVHAVMDALLGALVMGDIGKLFPDSDERYRDASSLTLLKEVGGRIREAGWFIVNIDSTIIAERPKFAPYIDHMRGNIAQAAGTYFTRVSVKATTTETLGFEGREEGIAAMAVALLTRRRDGEEEERFRMHGMWL